MKYSLDVIAEIITRDPDRGLFREATRAIDPDVYLWQWGPERGYGVINDGDSFALLELPNINDGSLNTQQIALMRKGWPRNANIPVIGRSRKAGNMIALVHELYLKHNIDLDEPWQQARRRPQDHDTPTGDYVAAGGESEEVWPSGMDYDENTARLGPKEAQIAERFGLSATDMACVRFTALSGVDIKTALQHEDCLSLISNNAEAFRHAIEIMLRDNRKTVISSLQAIPEDVREQMLNSIISKKSTSEPGKWGLNAQDTMVITMYLLSHPDISRPKQNSKLRIPRGPSGYISKIASSGDGFVKVIGQIAKHKGLGRALVDMTNNKIRMQLVEGYLNEHWEDYVGIQ